jgi:hypothetical protein
LQHLELGRDLAHGAHQAVRNGVLEPEGVADRDHRLARAHVIAVAEPQRPQPLAVDLENDEVASNVAVEHALDRQLLAVDDDDDLVVASHHVQVGDDEPLCRHDEAGAHRIRGDDGDDGRHGVLGDVCRVLRRLAGRAARLGCAGRGVGLDSGGAGREPQYRNREGGAKTHHDHLECTRKREGRTSGATFWDVHVRVAPRRVLRETPRWTMLRAWFPEFSASPAPIRVVGPASRQT